MDSNKIEIGEPVGAIDFHYELPKIDCHHCGKEAYEGEMYQVCQRCKPKITDLEAKLEKATNHKNIRIRKMARLEEDKKFLIERICDICNENCEYCEIDVMKKQIAEE